LKNKFRILIVSLAVVFALFSFTACVGCPDDCDDDCCKEPISVEVTFNTTSVNLQESEQADIIATVTPEEYRDNLVWAIGDNTVATISRTVGRSVRITAVKEGSTKITVTLPGSLLEEEITVTVTKMPVVDVESVSIVSPSNPLQVELTNVSAAGRPVLISANVFPANATNQNVTWSVLPVDVVSLGSTTGRSIDVTAILDVPVGATATITVTTQCGNFTDTLEVVVGEQQLED